MKLEIDTVNKTIRILSKSSVIEVMNFLKDNNWQEWSIDSDSKMELLNLTFIPYIYQPDPYSPPYIVTC